MPRISNLNKYNLDEDVQLTDYVIGTDSIENKRTKNFTVKKLLEKFDEVSCNVKGVYSDLSNSSSYYYYGGIYNGDLWIINRYDITDINIKQKATEQNNIIYTELESAWLNRELLTYI